MSCTDRSQTERIRRRKGQIQAVARAACPSCPEEGPQGPTDQSTWLSRRIGQMTYRKEIATGAIVEESCCTATTDGTTATSCSQTFTLSLKAGESVTLRNALSVPAFFIPTIELSTIITAELGFTLLAPGATYTVTNVTPNDLPPTDFTWVCVYLIETTPGTYTVDNSGGYRNNGNIEINVVINNVTYPLGSDKAVYPLTAGMTYTVL